MRFACRLWPEVGFADVDGFGDWDRAEGQGAASLILCILHVNTSVLPSSHSVAEYNAQAAILM